MCCGGPQILGHPSSYDTVEDTKIQISVDIPHLDPPPTAVNPAERASLIFYLFKLQEVGHSDRAVRLPKPPSPCF